MRMVQVHKVVRSIHYVYMGFLLLLLLSASLFQVEAMFAPSSIGCLDRIVLEHLGKEDV